MSRSLIVSIDTEEEGLWGGQFSTEPTTKNLRGLDRFQQFCEAREIVPTYLIDAPVVLDDWATARLRAWQEAGNCEVGSHCHPWCNPPLDGLPISNQSSYLFNLAPELQRRKLEWLTEQIEHKIGRRPTSFRAGRYGLDHIGAQILADLGYTVDSSVLPFRNYAPHSGPDFRDAKLFPYRISPTNLLEVDAAGRLLEVPVTSGFTRCGFRWRSRCQRMLTETPLRRFRLAGVLDRLDILRWLKLSPEQVTIDDAKRLINSAFKDGASVLVLMFHSSSLMPGYSPYVKTDAELEQFYQRLDKILAYCLVEQECESKSLTEFSLQLLGEGRSWN